MESHEDSFPPTPFSGVPQDFRQLFLKLTATQRQLLRAKETAKKKEHTLIGMEVNLLQRDDSRHMWRKQRNTACSSHCAGAWKTLPNLWILDIVILEHAVHFRLVHIAHLPKVVGIYST